MLFGFFWSGRPLVWDGFGGLRQAFLHLKNRLHLFILGFCSFFLFFWAARRTHFWHRTLHIPHIPYPVSHFLMASGQAPFCSAHERGVPVILILILLFFSRPPCSFDSWVD